MSCSDDKTDFFSDTTEGTFSIPITKDDQPDGPGVYHIAKNDGGAVTLHGGVYGWDRRGWTLVSKNSTSVTYVHLDNADEGFPGIVTVYVSVHYLEDMH